ncbi:MAG: preprotein translocase subunit TatA [Acidobacteria bacterium]|jgi:sec-independent protein translocase protein TatB|nr:MAG: preprotein translocase subunit TatA [Acidobacteriota bacterium]
MEFPELIVILAVAFIFLGPERMMEVATKLGEFARKIRETWDELRYQMYLENVNRKIDEESKSISYEEAITLEEEAKKEDDQSGPSQDALDGASEGTKKQAD